MLSIRTLPISSQTYVKDPFTSDLGQRILVEGIGLLNELGLEGFTFKKLAEKIDSTEASIYRYFTNKHMFLVYLCNLYWRWMDQRIAQLSYQKDSHYRKLEEAIRLIASPVPEDLDSEFPYTKLVDLINAEGPKVYLTKLVDEGNKEGVFMAYKSLCETLSQMILNINPEYAFAHSLASTVIETAHNQLFFSNHLPRLTDIDSDNVEMLHEYLLHTVASAIQ